MNSGIYAIYNTITGDCYVGQATDTKARWASHTGALAAGNHCSKAMQAAWQQQRGDGFRFEVLERCTAEDLDAAEYRWIVKLKPAYNTLIPDYAAAVIGVDDGRLRRRAGQSGVHPSKYLCECGQTKHRQYRYCYACTQAKKREMVAVGYIDQIEPDEQTPGSIGQLRDGDRLKLAICFAGEHEQWHFRERINPADAWARNNLPTA